MRKLKGSDEHLSVERAGSGQDALVSHKHTSFPHKHSVLRLFKDRVNTPSLSVQRVAASPLHSTWKCCAAGAGAASNHSAQPWWEGQSEDERKLDKLGKLEKDALAPPPLRPVEFGRGGGRAFCSCWLTAGLGRRRSSSSCYYCTRWCGLILPWAAPSASEIVIWAAPATRQPAAEARLHPR